MGIVEAIGEGTVKLFSSRKRILGILLLIAIAAATWRVFFYMSPEEKYWWHIEESKRLVKESTKWWDKVKETGNHSQAIYYMEKRIELHRKAKEHVLEAYELADTYPKKKYAELLAKALEYSIKSDEKFIEVIKLDEMGSYEAAKKAARESEELLKKGELELIKANGYLSIIQEGVRNE